MKNRSYVPYSLGFCLSLKWKFYRKEFLKNYFGIGEFGCGKNYFMSKCLLG